MNTPLFRKFHHSRFVGKNATAFTLIEVALSLGIISFAFVGVLGLLPVGLDVSRKAIDATIGAQIAQKLITEVQQTDFSLLTDSNTKFSTDFLLTAPLAAQAANAPSYFDDQGNKITDPSAISNGNFVYQAGFVVEPTTTLPDVGPTEKLATVTICLLNAKAHRTNLTEKDLKKNPDAKKYVVLIPDNGR
jgi:uncharacterized protein (TIGR02598 family)